MKKIPRATANPSRVFGEKEALQAVRHHNIVRLYRTFKDEDHLYFLMEFLCGGPLHRHVRRAANGRVSMDVARFWCAQVVLALRELHESGFVHRDVKLEND